MPHRTVSQTGDKVIEANWFLGGSLFAGNRIYDTWEYPERGVTLLDHSYRSSHAGCAEGAVMDSRSRARFELGK